MNVRCSVIVGRWPIPWSMIWYADVALADSPRHEVYVTFNAWTRRGVLKKANRYIKRHYNFSAREIYTWDETKERLINV